jgi:hypothetical protein
VNWGWLGGGAVGGVVAVVMHFRSFLRDRDRRRMKEEVMLVFMRDMAMNHLPHIYHALRQIAKQHGVELDEPPPIKFIEFNGDNKGH